MLAIRLMRTGKTHAPHYRIVVQEKRSKLNGKSVDTIGHYHPAQSDKLLVINKEKAEHWLKQGAQPSDTVINLFVKEGIFGKDKKVHNFFTPGKKEKEEKPAKEEKAEEVAEETPAEATAASEEAPEVSEAPASEEPAETTEETPAEETAPAAEESTETPEEPKAETAEESEKAPEADAAA